MDEIKIIGVHRHARVDTDGTSWTEGDWEAHKILEEVFGDAGSALRDLDENAWNDLNSDLHSEFHEQLAKAIEQALDRHIQDHEWSDPRISADIDWGPNPGTLTYVTLDVDGNRLKLEAWAYHGTVNLRYNRGTEKARLLAMLNENFDEVMFGAGGDGNEENTVSTDYCRMCKEVEEYVEGLLSWDNYDAVQEVFDSARERLLENFEDNREEILARLTASWEPDALASLDDLVGVLQNIEGTDLQWADRQLAEACKAVKRVIDSDDGSNWANDYARANCGDEDEAAVAIAKLLIESFAADDGEHVAWCDSGAWLIGSWDEFIVAAKDACIE